MSPPHEVVQVNTAQVPTAKLEGWGLRGLPSGGGGGGRVLGF